MTTWCDALNDENAVLSQVLYRDDGRPRGMIVRCRVGGGAQRRACLRPPHKPDVQFSRIRLS
jgi:hypothetical protein